MTEYPDRYWYDRLLTKDSASRPLTSIQKSIIIEKSMQEAKLQKTCMEKRFGKRRAEEYLEKLGITLVEEETEPAPSFLYLGLFVPGEKKVCLNLTTLSLVGEYLKSVYSEKKVRYESLREIVCFHELFHVIEEYTNGIYTRNVRVKHKFLHVFPYCRTVDAASEIGAIHFSKLMCGADFSPYVYMRYLLAATNHDLEVEDEP